MKVTRVFDGLPFVVCRLHSSVVSVMIILRTNIDISRECVYDDKEMQLLLLLSLPLYLLALVSCRIGSRTSRRMYVRQRIDESLGPVLNHCHRQHRCYRNCTTCAVYWQASRSHQEVRTLAKLRSNRVFTDLLQRNDTFLCNTAGRLAVLSSP